MSKRIEDLTYVALRVSAGALFMQHGFQKVFGELGGTGPAGGAVPLASQMGVAGLLELVGGGLLIIGLLTRPAAAVLVLEMIAAYFIAHAPQGPWPIKNQGELALVYAAVFAFFAGNGAGPMSVDAWLHPFRVKSRLGALGDRRHATA